MKNIVLIGFMGTGKTTTGKILAEKLGWRFFDADGEIERLIGLPVGEIFRRYGEGFFRSQESAVLKKMIYYKNAVIATGGGAVLYQENVDNLKKAGLIIALKAEPEIILQRIENDITIRPLLKSPDKLQTVMHLLQERFSKYQIAEHCIDTSRLTPYSVADTIIRLSNSRRMIKTNYSLTKCYKKKYYNTP